MPNYDVAPGVSAALRNFRLPDQLGFGPVAAPVMFSAEWANGAWGRGELVPYGAIQILPGARALQYAELVFEGLKAYKIGAPPIRSAGRARSRRYRCDRHRDQNL